jgi:hypothetical protein
MYETQSTVQGLAVMIISMIYEDIHRINLAYQEKISLLGTQLYSQISLHIEETIQWNIEEERILAIFKMHLSAYLRLYTI